MTAKTMLTYVFVLVLMGTAGALLYAAISGEGDVALWAVLVGGVVLSSIIEARRDLTGDSDGD